MTPRTITGAHRIYVLPKERNKSEYVDYCAQSTTLVEALTKDSLVEHLIIKCSDPWGFVFPEQLVSQTEREKPLRITLLLTEHIDHVRGNLPRWEEFVARARTEGKLKGQVYKSGWQNCVVPRGVYVPSGLMTRIACRDKGKYASNFPDPTKGGKQEDNFTYRFITDASLATDSTAEELAQIRAYFGVDLSHSFKPIRKIKNGVVTDTQADMWVYEFLYARQMIEAHGASSGIYMNMLYWLNASEANITDFWEVAETTENTAREIEGKLDKPKGGNYVLDKDIASQIGGLMKIGGRNLIKHGEQEKRTWGEWASYTLYKPIEKSEPLTLSFDVLNVEVPPDGGAFLIYFFYYSNFRTEASVKYEEGKKRYNVTVSKLDFNYSLYGDKKNYDPNQVFIYPNSSYKSSGTGGCFTIANIKLERGNVATDWTPAPEDMYAELDKYTTVEQYTIDRADDRRKLDNKLDKPTSGKYILDKDIPSEFEKLVKVGGRNLIVTKRWKAGYLYGDRDENAYPVGSENYKVLVGYGSFRFDPVYIPTLGESKVTYKLYDNGGSTNGTVQIHAYDKDKKFLWWDFDGWRGEIGRTRTYTLPTDTRYIRLGVTNKDVRAKVEFGNVATDWTPAPEDFQSDITDLQQLAPTKKQKEWLDNMGQVLLADSTPTGTGKTYHINGLSIDRSVFLRFSDCKPSALIGGGGGKGAVLMAGVQDYGTDNVSARMEIYQDGTARFGAVEMLFNGMRVKNDIMELVNPTSVREPLLISDTQPEFVENLARRSVENRNVISGDNVYLTNSTKTKQYYFSTSNPSTQMTITIERVRCEVYPQNSALEMLLDGVQIMSWRGNVSYERVDGSGFAGGGSRLDVQKTPSEETNITIEYILPKGNHTLLLRNTSTDSKDNGTFYGLKCNLYYDASEGSTILSACGFRAYTNNSRYFDIDRRPKYFPPSTGGNGGDDDLIPREGVSNPYIARVKGGMRLDSLTLEQPLDAPGCVLAGGRVENSYVRASFGKYKNKRGDSKPVARFDNNDKIYSVFHSIGNTNYTPIVTSCAGQWGDVPQVIGVYEYRFDVRFINYNNEFSVDWNFNYVCYKGD